MTKERSKMYEFEIVYRETYKNVLRYVVCNAKNINDVNDIIQEIYFEVYKSLNKHDIDNINAYIMTIAKNRMKRYYSGFYKLRALLFFDKNFDEETDIVDTLVDDFDLEEFIINNSLYNEAWQYIKSKKYIIYKIFFLYYKEDLSIKEIAKILDVNESYVKNKLYRTLNELKQKFSKEGLR